MAQIRSVPLDLGNLKLHNVKAEAVTYKGLKAVPVEDSGVRNLPDGRQIAIVGGTAFQNGTIEVDLTGDTLPGMGPEFRGFTGIAFRVSGDRAGYECFYLRPKNGRSDDQLQRNHSAQYISFPEFGWKRLREEFPAKYETYVDLVPGEWIHFKIIAAGEKARLYVNGSDQATLIVNDLKHGDSRGSVALWIGAGTIAHFANLRIGQ